MNTKRYKEIRDSFPEEQQRDIDRIWDLAGTAGRKKAETNELDSAAIDMEWQRLQERFRTTGVKEEQWATAELEATDEEPRDPGPELPSPNKERPAAKKSAFAKKSTSRVHRIYPVIAAVAAVLLAGFISWYIFVPVTIEAPRGYFVTHEWSDGTKVELNSGSQVTYNRSIGDGHRNLHLSGEAYFDIPTSDSPFVVETHNARIVVHGTRFNVRSWGDDPARETILTLVEGEVSLSSFLQPDDPILLKPGQWTRIDRDAVQPYEPEEIDTDRALAWREEGFFFSSTAMSQVAAELERRFNQNITIDNDDLADRRLSLYMPSPDNIEDIVASICHLTGCDYEWTDDHIMMF